MKREDRLKAKQYQYERYALIDFLAQHARNYSPHVYNAVSHRLGIIQREIKFLGAENLDLTKSTRPEAEAERLPFEPTKEELEAES